MAPAAMQQGRQVARLILRDAAGLPRIPFRFTDKGMMATIGRKRAVLQKDRLGVSGLTAWLGWLAVHIWYLIGARNKLVVMFEWAWAYLTWQRGARIITARQFPIRGQAT